MDAVKSNFNALQRARESKQASPSRPGLLRQMNARRLLVLLRANNPCSRAELVRLSGLSAPTVSSAIDYLARKNLVSRLGPGSSSGGRRPDMIAFNSSRGVVAGVDLGGTTGRLALADLDGKIQGRSSFSTRGNESPEKIVALIHSGLIDLLDLARIPRAKWLAVGLGVPGITDVEAGVVVSAPNLSGWQNVPLRDLLQSKLQVPAIIENDVNAAAVGEHWTGSAQSVSDFVFLAIGTGIGAGIFINNQLYHGSTWAAGEVGYFAVPGAYLPRIELDKAGALESAIGGKAIERNWRKVCKQRGAHAHLRATEIFELAAQGDVQARKLMDTSAQVLAYAITNICLLLNTSLVVLGGSVGTSEPLLRATREIVERNDFARPQLAISRLGPHAQLNGAIRLALNRVEAAVLP